MNDDTISRQAAIDAVKRLSLGETDATRLAMRIGDYLERLQSAQPDDYAKGYNDAKREIALSGEYERAYQRGKEDAQKWIPCSERLPDGRLNKSYLVQDKDGRRAVGTYTNWGWTFGHYMNDPVAWMPLPEPYKGGGQDEQIH